MEKPYKLKTNLNNLLNSIKSKSKIDNDDITFINKTVNDDIFISFYNEYIEEKNEVNEKKFCKKIEDIIKSLDFIKQVDKDKKQIGTTLEMTTKEIVEKKYGIINIAEIDSFKAYIEHCDGLNEGLISRGQKSHEYSFLPSAMRTLKDRKNYTSKEIEEMYISFKQKLLHYYPSFRGKTNVEIKAFAQHFGLPTYLLDFTESHLTSLLFAVEDYEDDDNDSIVIFVDAKKFNGAKFDTHSISDCSDKESIKELETNMKNNFIFVKSDDIHNRLHMQKGCFLSFPNKRTEDDAIKSLKEYMSIAIIPRQYKSVILSAMFSMGLNFEDLYPDLDNAVKSIKFLNSIREGGEL